MERLDDQENLTREFEVEKYKLDRLHELELNKFTHTLEMERLKLLTFLNGGAAAAWLTFPKVDSVNEKWTIIFSIVVPTLLWLLGLISASLATHASLTTQREFTKAYHRRRRADEWRLMRLYLDGKQIRQILPSLDNQQPSDTEEATYNRKADTAMTSGIVAARWVVFWTFSSITAFVFGALFAGASIAFNL